MRKFLTRFENSKKVLFRFGIVAVAAGILFSCIHLRAVYYPSEVIANSTFDVTMVVDMKNPLDGGTSSDSAYGFVGALIPVGWTIDPHSFSYENKIVGADSQIGTFNFDQDMTSYCIQLDKEQWGGDYYWQGFRTIHKVTSENMDSITIHFKVKTNNVAGDYQMLVGIQQTPYDKNKTIEPGLPGNALIDNDPNGPFYQISNKDSETKEYLSIKVVPSSGTSLKYVKSDNENYTVSSLNNGKLLVNLLDESKVGAASIVYDMNGKQVATQKLSNMKNVLDATLKPGLYFVAVHKDGIRSSKKVLVK
jgi:hypothetical protein